MDVYVVKANQKPVAANAAKRQETPGLNGHAAAEPDLEKAKWPIMGPSELTIHHVPPKVRDQIIRPYLAAAQVVGNHLAAQMESINDARGQVVSAARAMQKDAERLNQQAQLAGFGPALVRLGIAKERKPQPEGSEAE